MRPSVAGERFLASWVSASGYVGSPDVDLCDTLMAQCLDALPLAIWITNAGGGIAFYNRAAYRYYGPRIALPGAPGHLFHHDDFDTSQAAGRRAVRTGLSIGLDVRALRYDHTPFWHALHFTPLFGKTSMVNGLLTTMTGIDGPRDAEKPRDPFDPCR